MCVLLRNGPVWDRRELTDMDDVIDLPTMGVSCTVGDLYADTRWRPRLRTGPQAIAPNHNGISRYYRIA